MSWTILFLPIILILILFVPGYSLTAVLFEDGDFGWPERLLMSVGLSLGITALMGLLLYGVGLGIRLPWLLLPGMIGLFIVIIHYYHTGAQEPGSLPGFTFGQGVLLFMTAALITTAVYIAASPTAQQTGLQGYSLLWIQPGRADNSFRIGVQSEEFAITGYQLALAVNGQEHEGPRLLLYPGEKWEGEWILTPEQATGQRFIVRLYRLDRPNEVYRSVVWWLNETPPAPAAPQGGLP
jgi:hypothetical protein